MPQFKLDHGDRDGAAWFKSLDSFTQGYVEAMFFTADDDLKDKTVADLSAEARQEIRAQCDDFQKANEAMLSAAYATDEYDAGQAGRDFWFTRNRHGVGYWGRSKIAHLKLTPEAPDDIGAALTDAAHGCGETDLYEGDDGTLYLA